MGTQKTVLVTEDAAGSNTIKGVKIIGTESLNGRRYPIEVLEKCYKLYEGALVNINHKLGAEGRDYTDRIGRVVNVRCESDGLYGDLIYNPHHRDAKSLEWWAENDQNAVGLSHMAQVRSKWTPEGVEEVTDIVKVESVDLVANPATTKGLMESVDATKEVTEEDFFDMIAKRMEARAVRKKAGEPVAESFLDSLGIDEEVVLALDREGLGAIHKAIAAFKKFLTAEGKYKKTLMPEFFQKIHGYLSTLDTLDTQFGATLRKVYMGRYKTGGKSEAKEVPAGQSGKVVSLSGVKESEMSSEDLAAILANTELDDAGKIAAIQELIAGEAGGDEEEAPALPMGEAEDEMDKKDEEEEKPATESLKPQKMDPTVRRLMEEVETYRLRDKREKLVKEAREACKVLPTYAVTESFVGVLADSEKKNWKTLIEDRRKVIYRGEAPVSAAAPGGNLTVDALVKALRS